MKHTITNILAFAGATTLAVGVTAFAGTPKPASAPVVIEHPAVRDGSNWSRAPFPAARPQNDVTPPNGMAFDQDLPPNTPSTTPDPIAPPAPAFAVLQPRVAPGLEPTGLPGSGAAVSLDAPRMSPAIRSATFESRDTLVDGLRVRERESENTIKEFRRTESQMSTEGRSQFNSMRDDVKARQKDLDHALRTAADASAADWESARAQLATAYDAYANAVARMDAAVGVRTIQR